MSEKPEFNPYEESAGYAGDSYIHQPRKQPKQRLNIRVRRGLAAVGMYVEHYAYGDIRTLSKAEQKDIEAALRWIAENKQ